MHKVKVIATTAALIALLPLAACGGNSNSAKMDAARSDAKMIETTGDNLFLNLRCDAMSATEIDCTAPNSFGVKYRLSADGYWIKQ